MVFGGAVALRNDIIARMNAGAIGEIVYFFDVTHLIVFAVYAQVGACAISNQGGTFFGFFAARGDKERGSKKEHDKELGIFHGDKIK